METFGLFQLLNSLLPKGQEKPEKEEKKEENSPPPPQAEEPRPNACLNFFEAHDKRAGRRR